MDAERVKGRGLYNSLLEQGMEVVRTSPHGCVGNADVYDDRPEENEDDRESDEY